MVDCVFINSTYMKYMDLTFKAHITPVLFIFLLGMKYLSGLSSFYCVHGAHSTSQVHPMTLHARPHNESDIILIWLINRIT